MGAMEFQLVLKSLGQCQLSSDDVAALRAFLATLAHPGESWSTHEQPCY